MRENLGVLVLNQSFHFVDDFMNSRLHLGEVILDVVDQLGEAPECVCLGFEHVFRKLLIYRSDGLGVYVSYLFDIIVCGWIIAVLLNVFTFPLGRRWTLNFGLRSSDRPHSLEVHTFQIVNALPILELENILNGFVTKSYLLLFGSYLLPSFTLLFKIG